jgi:hypothetical protein
MSNVIAFPQSRTLAQVLAELMLAEAELARMQSRGASVSAAEDARWTELEDMVWLRRDEAKAMIEAATGVSWSAIEGANL